MPERILVVEDDPDIGYLISLHMKANGYTPVLVPSAVAAWEQLATDVPSAAIVDLRLSGSEDWSFIEELRDRFPSLPVLITTGVIGADVMSRAAELRCTYMAKPFEPDVLVETLKHTLNETSR